MRSFCAALAVCAMPIGDVDAQSFPTTPSVCEPDRLEIRDAGAGRAIVTYYNSAQQCSTGVTDKILTTPNGIEVSVTVKVNSTENEGGREAITLDPLDPSMFAFPPSGLLLDGETQEFLAEGGMS